MAENVDYATNQADPLEEETPINLDAVVQAQLRDLVENQSCANAALVEEEALLTQEAVELLEAVAVGPNCFMRYSGQATETTASGGDIQSWVKSSGVYESDRFRELEASLEEAENDVRQCIVEEVHSEMERRVRQRWGNQVDVAQLRTGAVELRKELERLKDGIFLIDPVAEILQAGYHDPHGDFRKSANDILDALRNANPSITSSTEVQEISEDLELRVASLERIMGSEDCSFPALDPLHRKIGFSSLHEGLRDCAARVLTLDPSTLQAMNNRMKTVLEGTKNLSMAVHQLPADVGISLQECRKIETLYARFIRWRHFGPLLDQLIQRLTDISAVHTAAALAANSAEALDARVAQLEERVTKLRVVSEEISSAVDKLLIV